MSKVRNGLLLLTVCAAVLLAWGQQPPNIPMPPMPQPPPGSEGSQPAQDTPQGEEPTAVFKARTDLVQVFFNVKDKKGGLIPNLTKDDFQIFEDGKPQTVKYFSKETDLPLTIGMLVDVSASQGNLIEIERSAASQFFNQVIKKKDQAFLISFGSESELLQDLTNSARLLQRGLDSLKLNAGFSGIHPSSVPGADRPHGTVLFDAVYLAASDRLIHEVGRKVMVLITDGGDQGSKVNWQKAVEAAQKTDSVIYSVYYVDPAFYYRGGFSLGGAGDKNVLRKMSDETGGHVYEVDRKHTLNNVFDELQQEMRSQYAIGYTPSNPNKDGSYRKIEIKLKDKDLKIQARKGYYAIKPGSEI
jgi:VWFA-related protein